MKKSKKRLGKKAIRTFSRTDRLALIRSEDLELVVGGRAIAVGDIHCAVVIDGMTYEHNSYVIGHTN